MEEQLRAARRICLDTNAIIYHLHRVERYSRVISELFDAFRRGVKEALVSVVTELELLVLPIRSDDIAEIERVGALLNGPGMSVIDMDRDIAQLSGRIRAVDRLHLPDAVIVATAIYADCDVIVGNDARCAQRVRDVPYVFLDELVKEQGP